MSMSPCPTMSRILPFSYASTLCDAGMKGVVSVSVSLMGKQGAVTYQPEIVTGHDLVQNVQSAGYDAEIIDENVEVQGISDSYSAEADEFRLQVFAWTTGGRHVRI